MRTRITLAIVGLAVLVVSGLMAWPRIEDQIRESRCDFYLNESKRTPARWVKAFFEREDEPAGWRTFLDHLGAKRIGDYNAESYRVVLIPMIRYVAITVVLDGAPHWEETIHGEPPRQGVLTKKQVAEIRAMVSRCRFWEIGDYVALTGYLDGESWVFEGERDGKYRRIYGFCPERRSYVYALCTTVAGVTDPAVFVDTRAFLSAPKIQRQ